MFQSFSPSVPIDPAQFETDTAGVFDHIDYKLFKSPENSETLDKLSKKVTVDQLENKRWYAIKTYIDRPMGPSTWWWAVWFQDGKFYTYARGRGWCTTTQAGEWLEVVTIDSSFLPALPETVKISAESAFNIIPLNPIGIPDETVKQPG